MAKTVKVTVSMPVEDVERLNALDAAGAIEWVSGYVAQAVHDRLERQAWLAHGHGFVDVHARIEPAPQPDNVGTLLVEARRR